ncbi:MAG: hypothetical protein Q8O83_00580 [bacterium]|nr:hypothetical protein [bacterium]
MDDTALQEKLNALDEKINAVYISVEKTRKYFLVTMIVTVVVFVLPLIGLLFAIPAFLSSLNAVTTGGF